MGQHYLIFSLCIVEMLPKIRLEVTSCCFRGIFNNPILNLPLVGQVDHFGDRHIDSLASLKLWRHGAEPEGNLDFYHFEVSQFPISSCLEKMAQEMGSEGNLRLL